jgi:hypothetical protein
MDSRSLAGEILEFDSPHGSNFNKQLVVMETILAIIILLLLVFCLIFGND